MTAPDRGAAGSENSPREPEEGQCNKIPWPTAESAAQTVSVVLRANLYGKRWGRTVTATLCPEHQAFHLSSSEGGEA